MNKAGRNSFRCCAPSHASALCRWRCSTAAHASPRATSLRRWSCRTAPSCRRSKPTLRTSVVNWRRACFLEGGFRMRMQAFVQRIALRALRVGRCLDRRLDWRDAESAIDDRCRGGLPRRTVDVRAEGSAVLAIRQASAVRLNRIGCVPWVPCVFGLRCDTVARPSDSMMAQEARGSPDTRFRWPAHSHTQAARTDRVAQQHGESPCSWGEVGRASSKPWPFWPVPWRQRRWHRPPIPCAGAWPPSIRPPPCRAKAWPRSCTK